MRGYVCVPRSGRWISTAVASDLHPEICRTAQTGWEFKWNLAWTTTVDAVLKVETIRLALSMCTRVEVIPANNLFHSFQVRCDAFKRLGLRVKILVKE